MTTTYIIVMEAIAIIALTATALVLNSRVNRLMDRVDDQGVKLTDARARLNTLNVELDSHRRISEQAWTQLGQWQT